MLRYEAVMCWANSFYCNHVDDTFKNNRFGFTGTNWIRLRVSYLWLSSGPTQYEEDWIEEVR